ncbi:MAG TPA: FkbM family methyltransferase [Fimbriimonas sp.]|nr:FkbM family methyltransferase [Fimbriimonas sp.]
MNALFFPNQSQEDQELEFRLRSVVAALPENARLGIYSVFSRARGSFEPTIFSESEGMVVAHQKGREIAFPKPVPLVKLSHIVFSYEQLLQRKYWLPGFVEVEPGDVVIDCGAYVGGFSLSACKVAGQIHAFEPDESNFRCLTRNFQGRPNMVLNQAGLYSESKTMTLNLSESSVEHSLLAPDDGTVVGTQTITVHALQDYCREKGIERIDFCKIEAEGVELEVFEGLRDMRPRKIAIDVSPERNGESPADEFIRRLAPMGYDLQRRGNVLFARERSAAVPMPRMIYSLWLQGRQSAPEIVEYNFQRWERLNPGYELRVLDEKAVDELLKDCGLATGSISKQGLSDVVRLRLLKEHGGVWTDASVLPILPLDDWLPAATQAIEFFAFEREDVPLSSWFLAVGQSNPIVDMWWKEVERLWSSPREVSTELMIPSDPAQGVSPEILTHGEAVSYFWVHCLFQYLLEQDPLIADMWLRRYRLSSMPAHDLQTLFAEPGMVSDEDIRVAAYSSPVQKLDWRQPYPIERFERALAAGPPIVRPSAIEQIKRPLRRIKRLIRPA